MPLATSESAAPLISCSLTLHWNLFQLFQPMGGVSARASPACAGATAAKSRAVKKRGRTRRMSPSDEGGSVPEAPAGGDESDGSVRRVAARVLEPRSKPGDDLVE